MIEEEFKKIHSIEIKNFKGIGNSGIELLLEGKSAVIFGENGAGKTSIARAISAFIHQNIDGIKKNRNLYSKNEPEILFRYDGKEYNLKNWSDDPEFVRYLEMLANTHHILGYRELSKAYFVKDDRDIFTFFKELLRNVAVTKTEIKRFRDIEDEVLKLQSIINTASDKRRKKYKDATKNLPERQREYNNYLRRTLNQIKPKIEEYYEIVSREKISLEFEIPEIGERLKIKCQWNGKEIKDIHQFLNEGRLSAIALATYFSYLEELNPSPYRFLIFDDLLIGLDMNHRLPIIRILKERLKEYQIILMTYDEIWFNILKKYLCSESSEGWKFFEISYKDQSIVLRDSNYNLEKLDCDYYLQKVAAALDDDDRRTAAFYLRLEFERLLKVYYKKCRKKVVYKEPPQYHTTQDFWEGIKDKVGEDLKKDVESYRTFLLNPMAHYSNPPVYESEIVEAIEKLRELRDKLCNLTFDMDTRKILKPEFAKMHKELGKLESKDPIDIKKTLETIKIFHKWVEEKIRTKKKAVGGYG
jgi:ABC-type dipeptide/oligopeptide/nickel transport system ATPase subunit